MLKRSEKITISLYCIVLLFTSFSNSSMEVNISGVQVSPETITQILLIVFLSLNFLILNRFNQVKVSIYEILFWLCLISIFSYLILDIIFLRNFNAFYELNFILLLSFIPLSIHIFKKAPHFFQKFIYVIIFIIILQAIFFQNNFNTSWDTVRDGGEVISRLSILGYVSSTFAIILSLFIVFLFSKLLNRFQALDLLLLLGLTFYLLQTFSRTGLLVSFVGITCLIFYKNLFYGLIWSITIFIGLLLSFSYLAASDQGLILKFLESDYGLNNPRIVNAVQALSRLELTFQLFLGNGFFITPTDNTLVGLISGRGAVGVILYSLLLFLLLPIFHIITRITDYLFL